MLKSGKVLPVLLPVLLAGFAFGIARLFQLRFESGDVYPPYSSLRADPLGARAFYESLDELPGLTVRRHVRTGNTLPEGRNTTLFVAGARVPEMRYLDEDEFKSLERFMFEGGRIVVSLLPPEMEPWLARVEDARQRRRAEERDQSEKKGDRKSDDRTGGEPPPQKRNQRLDEDEWFGANPISLKERWGVEFDYKNLPRDDAGVGRPVSVRRHADLNLPEWIAWQTGACFDAPGTNWRTIYRRDDRPVLIERRFGGGSIVLSADSYFLSNEAMRKDRYPELLAWLVGSSGAVLFDETHLGVTEDPGIAALIRKYRLHGLVAGLVVLAGLFVWRNAMSFVPGHDEDAGGTGGDVVTGKESAAGFVNLLRRSIASSELLSVCFAEWKKSCAHGRPDLAARMDRMARLLTEEQSRPARERNAIETYRKMSRILAERSGFEARSQQPEPVTRNP